jgi:hypothetical protein
LDLGKLKMKKILKSSFGQVYGKLIGGFGMKKGC